MGGHGHQNKLPYPIPKPEIYNVDHVPELKELESRLSKKGLKDPWIRNQVWQYPSDKWNYKGRSITGSIVRGFLIGFPAFLATIAIERYFGIDYHLLGYHHVSNPDRHLPPPHHH